MIILSVGMPRAGSGWYYNLTNDLILAAGLQDAHEIRQRYHLQGILTEVNCNIGALTVRRLSMVSLPALMGNTFVIKAHAAPTPYGLTLMRINVLRAAYIYRDPRDAMLSAFENGQRALEKGRPNAFSHLTDFETSLEFIIQYTRIWQEWASIEQALHTRFEDLLENYAVEASRLARFLGLDENTPAIAQVIEKYQPAGAAQSEQRGLHFSKGKKNRFRQVYTADQQAILAERLGPYLVQMGYPI
jgi:hypothetical protein